MTARIVLRPGRMPLADWGAILGGAEVGLDPLARIDVEAGRAALAAIIANGDPAAPLDPAADSASVAELIEARGALLPEGRLRLLVALKLASLGQGVSGVRWEVAEALAALLSADLLPVVPEAASDRLALAHLCGALTGASEVLHRGRIRPAADALRDAGVTAPALDPRERNALLSGNEPTLATVLAWLFTAERAVQSAVVAAALSAAVGGSPTTTLGAITHRLHRQRGQSDIATTLRALSAGEADSAHDGAGTNAGSGDVFRFGAALDLLRQAGALLERAANGVSESRLVLWQNEAMVPGIEDMTSLTLAVDLMAFSLTTLGSVTAARIATTVSADNDRDGAAARAATLAEANHKRGGAPTLNPSDMERLPAVLETASEIVAIAFLAAARRSTGGEGKAFDAVWERVRAAAPARGGPGLADADVRAVAELVRSGDLATAPGVPLPSVAPKPPR